MLVTLFNHHMEVDVQHNFPCLSDAVKVSKCVSMYVGLGHSCPSNFNPPDFFLDLLSPDNRSLESEAESRNRIQSIATEW